MPRLVRALLVLTVIAIVSGHSPGAWACSCAGGTDESHFDDADVVFIGTATDHHDPNEGEQVQSSGDPIGWEFDVGSAQKGAVTDPANVKTARDGATCGFGFQIGERYQVFAYREDGSLSTGLCTGTRALSEESAYTPQGADGEIMVQGGRLARTGVERSLMPPALLGLFALGTLLLLRRRAA